MKERKHSPMYFAVLALAGAVLAASTFFLSFAHIPRFQTCECSFWAFLRSDWLRLLVFLLPFAIGLAVSFWAEKRLKRNFQQEAWKDADLAPVRAFLDNPIWTWISVGIGVSFFFFFVRGENIGFSAFASAFWFVFLPLMTVTRIRQFLTPRLRKDDLRDWRDFKPLQSEHWGKPPQ